VAIGKQPRGVTVQWPETAQHPGGRRGQGRQTVLMALGIPDRHPSPRGVDIADLKAQPLAEAKAQAVEGEQEHPVAHHLRDLEQPLRLRHDEDVRQTLGPGRLDQVRGHPRLAQHRGVEELQAVQVQFDRAPRVRGQQVHEAVGQLRLGRKPLSDPLRRLTSFQS